MQEGNEGGRNTPRKRNQDKEKYQETPVRRDRGRNTSSRDVCQGWKWECQHGVGEQVHKVSDSLSQMTGLHKSSFYPHKLLNIGMPTANVYLTDWEIKHRNASKILSQRQSRKGRVGTSVLDVSLGDGCAKPAGGSGQGHRVRTERSPRSSAGSRRSGPGTNIRL